MVSTRGGILSGLMSNQGKLTCPGFLGTWPDSGWSSVQLGTTRWPVSAQDCLPTGQLGFAAFFRTPRKVAGIPVFSWWLVTCLMEFDPRKVNKENPGNEVAHPLPSHFLIEVSWHFPSWSQPSPPPPSFLQGTGNQGCPPLVSYLNFL